MIEVNHLSKTFGSKFTRKNCVLNDVSFTLPDKGLVAIFGKSGSGKTTLLNIIGGLDIQNKGYICIDNEKITGKNRDRVRDKKIGFIFQNYYLEKGYSVSEILYNAMKIAGFTDDKEIKRRTSEVLELVDLKKYEHKSADALSGGQKQRVAIARALIKGTNIILADEPTGNLDVENTIHVMNILKKISETRLVVLVTHETSLINKYADSHIELIDGVLQTNTTVLDSNGYVFNDDDNHDVEIFSQSESKNTGKLFNLKTIFKFLRINNEKKGNIFKKLFLVLMAIISCVFAFSLNESINNVQTHKKLNENSVYTNLNTYSELSMINRDYYENIDFFEINQRSGNFSYNNISSIASLKELYTPKAIEKNTSLNILYGNMPSNGQVLISKMLADNIKHDLRINELENDEALLLMKFDNDYSISGIVDGDENQVWFTKIDFVNFLGIYNNLKFIDNNHLFFNGSYSNMTYSATIKLYDGNKELNDNQIVIDISRNSLYKMMSNTSEADYISEIANKKLVNQSTAIYIENSEMYVKSFNITREVMDTDITINVTSNALDNIFVYLTPNIDILGNDTTTSYYFEISTNGGVQLDNLNDRLNTRGIKGVDINSIYENMDELARTEKMQIVYILIIAIVLTLCIYYFIEMSESLKNSKEYGIYRAIGVNKSNLLFKEMIRVLYKNIIVYFVGILVATILFASYYSISNLSFGLFIGISTLVFVSGAVLMLIVSLLPYLFVITKTPSEIISRYDI